MSNEVPQWVRLACVKWGRVKCRIWRGEGDWYVTVEDGQVRKQRHVDGYAQSFLGRLLDERYAGRDPNVRQHWPEVYWGEALDVQRGILGMAEGAFRALHLRYVFDPDFGLSARDKARLLRLSIAEYWRNVDRGETWIWAKLDENTCINGLRPPQVPEPTKKPLLPFRQHKPTLRANSARLAELSLGALQRPILSLTGSKTSRA